MNPVLTIFNEQTGLKNQEIFKSLLAANSKINNPAYRTIMCSISGGSDSDCMIDITHKVDVDKKVRYVWFDTGLEYAATKEHLKYLEEKYSIVIEVEKAVKAIPTCVRTYGQPFLSKQVSEYISRLQRYEFQWEDQPIEVLLERYCTWNEGKQDYEGCKIALQWWCNDRGEGSRFNIEYNKYLKEFLMAFPPQFAISNKCCEYAKKKVKHRYIDANDVDLSITGLRKSEGGVRATAYKTCFTNNDDEDVADEFRPLWWYKNSDKKDYEEHFNVPHSRCYTEYGLKRTGCCGCPFGRDFEEELKVIEKHEPKLYKAVQNIFGESYEYMRMFNQFKVMMKEGKDLYIVPRPFKIKVITAKKTPQETQLHIDQFLSNTPSTKTRKKQKENNHIKQESMEMIQLNFFDGFK